MRYGVILQVLESNINDTQILKLPQHIRHCISIDRSSRAARHPLHNRHPHFILSQLLNFRHTTHPITRRILGEFTIYQWLFIFTPSPHTGAFDSMSIILQRSLLLHPGHSTPRFITPLQKVILSCFLHCLHFIFRLTLMGEPSICIILLGATSSIIQTGLPSKTVRVENRYCGGQCSYDCPSGLMMRIDSLVLRISAILSISVQYCQVFPPTDSIQLGLMMLSQSRVNWRMEECLLYVSLEKRAVLLLLKNILVFWPQELDQTSIVLPLAQGYSGLSSLTVYGFVRQRSVSGSSLSWTGNSTQVQGCCKSCLIFWHRHPMYIGEIYNSKDR